VKRGANARGVRAQQIHLQLANLIWRNTRIAELAYSGSHSVGDAIFSNHFFNHLARSENLLASVGRKQHRTLMVHHFAQIGERELFSVDVEGVQKKAPGCWLLAAS
jgi:hypothetical protein